MDKKNNVWNYHVEEIVKGYAEEEGGYHCVFCDSHFSKGRIYRSIDIYNDPYKLDACEPEKYLNNEIEKEVEKETEKEIEKEVEKEIEKDIEKEIEKDIQEKIPEKQQNEMVKKKQADICDIDYKGRFVNEGELFDAYGAIRTHVGQFHGNAADWLLQWDMNVIGVSEIQRNILRLISEGKNDREISLSAGIAESTVRNHRFKLREKEKQAKLFLALMKSLEQKTDKNIANSDKGEIEETHLAATMPDDRYSITEEERARTIRTYMDENGAIRQFPAREKKKIILLGEVMKNLKSNVKYTEAEINRVLKRIYPEDYAGIRRALIEYGFMDRNADCSSYMVRG